MNEDLLNDSDDLEDITDESLEALAEEWEREEESEWDMFRDDVEADADALASAGFGTDEDYGYFGSEDY